MTFVPLEELKDKSGFQLAPMLDFLFLLLAFFISLSVTRNSTQDTELELVKAKGGTAIFKKTEQQIVQIAVLENGSYQWLTKVRHHPLASAAAIGEELKLQYKKGLLPEDKKKTLVLLKIDKDAKWEPVLQALLTIRQMGFEARPLYTTDK